jgi:HSP20 family protein
MNTLIRRSSYPGFEGFPAAGLSLFEDTLNRFFDTSASARPWSPAVDIMENENELLLTADVPGVRMEDIEIKIEEGTLTLSGKRAFQKEAKEGGYHRLERSYGEFQRAFALPDSVDADHVAAGYENGVLRITLPKKEIAKPRTIKVAVGSQN